MSVAFAALAVTLAVGAASAPAGARVAGMTKAKVAKIAAKVVDEKAATLSVAHATTSTTATTAEKALTAGDSSKLAGQPASAYRNSIIAINSPALYTQPASRLIFTVTGLPEAVTYLLTYDFAFQKSVSTAVVSCYVGLSNPITIGSSGGNSETALRFVSGSTTTSRTGNREPQITCDTSAGTIRIADAKTSSTSSDINLLKIEDFALGTASAATLNVQ